MSKHTSLNAIVMMYATGEIVILARHQKEILERRFPNMLIVIHEYDPSNDCLMIVGNEEYPIILQISFRPNSIEIIPPDILSPNDKCVTLDYADPKFTDDTISDILKEWEIEHAHA